MADQKEKRKGQMNHKNRFTCRFFRQINFDYRGSRPRSLMWYARWLVTRVNQEPVCSAECVPPVFRRRPA